MEVSERPSAILHTGGLGCDMKISTGGESRVTWDLFHCLKCVVLATELLTLQLPFYTAGWDIGCLMLKAVWRHKVGVLGVSHDVGSPAVGCPVIPPTTQGTGYPTVWDVLRMWVLIGDTQHREKRHFGLIFTR